MVMDRFRRLLAAERDHHAEDDNALLLANSRQLPSGRCL